MEPVRAHGTDGPVTNSTKGCFRPSTTDGVMHCIRYLTLECPYIGHFLGEMRNDGRALFIGRFQPFHRDT